MARQSLQAELEAYLADAEDLAREELAKTYQQEVVFHVDDFTDSLFKSWDAQGVKAAETITVHHPHPTPPPPKTDRRTKEAKKMKVAFDKGAKVMIDHLADRIPKIKKPTSGWNVPMPYTSVVTSRFNDDLGLVIYMLSPTEFNFESTQFKGVITRAKKKGLEVINKELKTLGKRKLEGGKGGAGSDIWGHHGGISGSDPKSTYGLAGIPRAGAQHRHIDEEAYEPVVDEGGELDSYSDIFWKRLDTAIKAEGYWDTKQHTRRPDKSGRKDAGIDDTHVMRIVFGHKDLNIMGPYDKAGASSSWTKLGPVLKKLLEGIRKDVEKDIAKHFKDQGKKVPDMSGSETPRTRIGKLGAETVIRKLVRGAKKGGKGPAVKIDFKLDPVKKSGSVKHNLKAKGKGKGKSPIRTRKGSRTPVKAKKTKKRSQTRSRSAAAMSPVGLVALLNKSLPAQVQKNMAPLRGSFPRRLTNRSGRFAGSAEVTNVAPYPKMVEIQYTYQKDPYAVFERDSGSPLATGPARDPREIIGESIREIAQSLMGTRFGIVRTKRV